MIQLYMYTNRVKEEILMTKKFTKKRHKHNDVIYTIITAVLLIAILSNMINYFYQKAEDDAYENLHIQTNQIKDVFVDVHFQNGHSKVGLKGG